MRSYNINLGVLVETRDNREKAIIKELRAENFVDLKKDATDGSVALTRIPSTHAFILLALRSK